MSPAERATPVWWRDPSELPRPHGPGATALADPDVDVLYTHTATRTALAPGRRPPPALPPAPELSPRPTPHPEPAVAPNPASLRPTAPVAPQSTPTPAPPRTPRVPSPTPRPASPPPAAAVGAALVSTRLPSAAGQDGGRHCKPDPEPGWERIDERQAVGLASAFAADLTSWDRSAPGRRVAALRTYLPADGSPPPGVPESPARQRAEMVIPGRVTHRSERLLIVSVLVRVTPYEQLPGFTGPIDPAPHATSCRLPGARPAAAGPPWEFGWTAGPSEWISLDVPVGRQPDGDLVVVVDPDKWRN